jgi:hypothetical protein
VHTPATTSLAPEAGVVNEVQVKLRGPLRVCPTPGFRWFVNLVTHVRTEEQETFRALSVYLSPAMLPPDTAARMRQGAPLITIVQSDTATAAAWEAAVCAGRAWTVTAKTSAVEQTNASVAVAFTRMGIVRFIAMSLRFPPAVAGRTLELQRKRSTNFGESPWLEAHDLEDPF